MSLSANIRRRLPILDWGRRYDRATLTNDLVAAVIVTIMLIPQSLAYAMLAGLPPVDEYSRDEVIGGPGAFLRVAEGYESFAGAVRRKIIREIAAIPAPGPLVEREYA